MQDVLHAFLWTTNIRRCFRRSNSESRSLQEQNPLQSVLKVFRSSISHFALGKSKEQDCWETSGTAMFTIPYWPIPVIGTQLRPSKSLLFQINHLSQFSLLPHYKMLICRTFPLHLLHSFPAKPVTAVSIQLTFSSLKIFFHHSLLFLPVNTLSLGLS